MENSTSLRRFLLVAAAEFEDLFLIRALWSLIGAVVDSADVAADVFEVAAFVFVVFAAAADDYIVLAGVEDVVFVGVSVSVAVVVDVAVLVLAPVEPELFGFPHSSRADGLQRRVPKGHLQALIHESLSFSPQSFVKLTSATD